MSEVKEALESSSGEVTQLLGNLRMYLEQAVDAAKEQAPEVAQEILGWGMAEAIITMVVTAVVGVGFATFLWKAFHKHLAKCNKTYDCEHVPIGFLLAVGGGLVSIFCVSSFYYAFLQLAQVLVAPRVFIINFLKGLV